MNEFDRQRLSEIYSQWTTEELLREGVIGMEGYEPEAFDLIMQELRSRQIPVEPFDPVTAAYCRAAFDPVRHASMPEAVASLFEDTAMTRTAAGKRRRTMTETLTTEVQRLREQNTTLKARIADLSKRVRPREG